MNIGEIISDALVYPLHNIKSLIIYVILGILIGVAIGGTVAIYSVGAASQNIFAILGSSILTIIVSLLLGFFISGYQLDITKYGIERRDDGPGIDFVRQFFNGFKLFIVSVVYLIIPLIIAAIVSLIFQNWLSILISVIVTIIFSFALIMGQCRLAKTDDLGYALSIGDAIGDISKVGFGKIIALIIVMFIIIFILFAIAGAIQQLNTTLGGIILGILGVYTVFFIARATGLLYSDV